MTSVSVTSFLSIKLLQMAPSEKKHGVV